MKIFNKNGLLYIPQSKDYKPSRSEKLILVKECFCSNGHNLISKQAQFGNYEGIVLKIRQNENEGIIALSPIYGDKSKVTFNITLIEDKTVTLSCYKCGVNLPVYGNCECGGELVIMFTAKLGDFNNCVGICNRVGCKHAEIKNEGQLLSLTSPEII